MGSEWTLTETGVERAYSAHARGEVRPTGQGYGPLYRWELRLMGEPAGHGHENTQEAAQAAADAALSRLVATLGRAL